MKKVLLFIISFLLLIGNIKAIKLDINSKYAYCYNLTEDRVMYNKNADDEIKVASLTKIMTSIIVIENNKDLNKKITVLDEDLRDMYEYTTAGFQDGDSVTIKDLLYGILLASGSDAVNAAVRITSTTEDEFVTLMNQKVKELNLTHTHFSNPIGKDDGNYSSMADIAKLLKYSLNNKIFKEVITTKSYIVKGLNLQINWPMYNSINKYEIDTSIVNGAKAGYTNASKYSFASYSEKNNIEYIVVTSYADKYQNSISDIVNIYNYFFNNYEYQNININFNINIKNGKDKYYNINTNPKLYLEKNYDTSLINYKYRGKNQINFLTKKGDKLGTVSIYYGKNLIKKIDVILDKNIEYNKHEYLKLIYFILLIIFIVVLFNIIKKLKKKNNKKLKKLKQPKNHEIKIERQVVIDSVEIEKIIKEENSVERSIEILNTTRSVSVFFDNLKIIKEKAEKEILEHNFIDRCFEYIDFKNIEQLRDLYTKLKLYNKSMEPSTVNYYNKLFRYCITEYIDK